VSQLLDGTHIEVSKEWNPTILLIQMKVIVLTKFVSLSNEIDLLGRAEAKLKQAQNN
jgi:hypothetical protein